MPNKFIKLFEYEAWANTEILKALRALKEPGERAVTLFSHLLSSHSMWLSRVTKTEMTCTIFQERTLDECEQLIQENLQGWKKYLSSKSAADLEEKIEFNRVWENPQRKSVIVIEDALNHIINHSSYHKGQIIVHIKGKVDELPFITYIMYASELI
jgi:uncharacterized damage-inducible protein DinB